MRAAAAVLGLALSLGLSSSALISRAGAEPMKIVVLGGLDKITARVTTFEAPIGKTVTFGSL